MNTKNNVGLAASEVKPIIESLSSILADYQVFYTNLRGLHWHIEGDKFFELHQLYEEYYDEFAEQIDEIAERILMIGGSPENRFSAYLRHSDIQELTQVSDWLEGTTHVLESLKLFVSKWRRIQGQAIQSGDAGTASLAIHGIKKLEKKIWMLAAYVK